MSADGKKPNVKSPGTKRAGILSKALQKSHEDTYHNSRKKFLF